jgi:CzcA family heavy metal efflux pump
MLLSDYAIRHHTTVAVLILITIVAGLSAYVTLPRESAPDIEFPFILVRTPYEGATPSDIESLITYPIERKLKGLTDVEEMESTSAEGISVIVLEFQPSVDIDTALQRVRDKVDEAKPDLPDDLEDDPAVEEISSDTLFPVLYVNISGEVGLVRLKQIAEDLEEDIETVQGVLDAEILGGLEREIRVEFDSDRVSAYRLTIGEIVQTVAQNNLNTPGGSLDIGEAKYNLKAPSEFTSPAEIDNLVVAVRDGKPIYLWDVATVRDSFKDRDSFSRVNGNEAVSLKVTKRSGENLLEIANRVKAIVAGYDRRLPDGIHFTYTSDSSEDIELMVSDLENNILTALILVLVVIFVSLGSRNALLVALAIPLSMLISFYALEVFSITLNMVVLFSLILALGMLVDNAIVITENIYRHHVDRGMPIVEAAMSGTAEVAWPVIASTATTVVAFVPLVFWPGIMGEFMSYLPKTVIITLLASLFVALVMTPCLAVFLVRRPRRLDKSGQSGLKRSPFVRGYGRFLDYGLNFRILSLVFFLGLLAISVYAYAKSNLGVILFPDTEPRRILVSLEAPEGTNIYRTNEYALQAENLIAGFGNLKFVTASVGRGLNQGSGPNEARITIDLVDREFRKSEGEDGKNYFRNSNDTMEAIRKDLRDTMVGVEVTVDKQEEGPPVGAPINVEVSGEDYPTLARLAQTLKEEIASIPGLVDLKDDYRTGLPEVNVVVDKERAALLGLNSFLIGQLVKASVNGIKIGDYREGEDEFDITARLPADQRRHLPDILRLSVPAPDGSQVPLTSVAQLVTGGGLSSIKHLDKKRVVTVSANVAKGFNTQQILNQIRRIVEPGEGIASPSQGLHLPPGYQITYTGENEDQEESQAFLAKAFAAAILLIFLVIVMQFDSILTPFIIMTSVLLSFIGVFLGLTVTRESFSVIMTGMGVISLAGVVVNNAIVLLDYTNILRNRGMECRKAIVEAACTRFRPVMLTAITTILGLVPMAVGVSFNFRKWQWEIGGESSQWWGPMAIAVIFGLAVATVLTLYVVPCLYSLAFEERRPARQPASASESASVVLPEPRAETTPS